MQALRKFRQLGALLVMLSIFGASGGHWAALQGVAWVKMTLSFSQKNSVTTSLRKTFDGKHPCELCKNIRKARHQEDKAPQNIDLKQNFDYFLPTTASLAPLVPSPNQFQVFAYPDLVSWNRTPPTPPPRVV